MQKKNDKINWGFWWGMNQEKENFTLKIGMRYVRKNPWWIEIWRTEEMNKVLLGKHAWRLISQPESLTVAILLRKYCNKTAFTLVKPKPNDLWCWKSILVGRDVFVKGMDVQI